ncbi:response regulator transcription factor [Humibacter ginsenosidimutans]|uniref:Response regulator transcription factor n=1 Tax=Humibacter ginsenosidimutans TaxID=2599293 RepID=A0A5B8M699_9MICO|nr:response regulator transcription factor [Humibacter ginsenosidimutans]QDZ16137.1 response regulator transcription factor [Humibacter ginsenosidimutans]
MVSLPASVAARNSDLIDRRVLVVEDDPTMLEVASSYLSAAGFLVDQAVDGFAALDAARRRMPDLIVLDRMLPGIDGAEVCRRLRVDSDVPVLLLTALRSEEARIEGLESGADDYLTKPFSPRELVLRVQSVLRRSLDTLTPEAPVDLGPFHLEPSARIVSENGELLSLSAREFDLLAFLIKHPSRVFSRDELLRLVWGWDIGDRSTVTVTVRRLREKIERNPAEPELLRTVWGVGYRFDVDAAVQP